MAKTVIITGAGGSLGRAVVDKFLNSGYNVVATVANGKKGELPRLTNLDVYEIDASNEKQTDEFTQIVIGKYPTIDAAIMLIGGYTGGSIANTGKYELNQMFTLNFYTGYFIARPIFNQMLKQSKGRLVFIASDPAINDAGGYNALAYTLSKSLLVKLSKILNSEGQKKGVASAVISPTTIDTPQNRTSMPDADFSKWTKPEAIAETIEFICSERSGSLKDVIMKY